MTERTLSRRPSRMSEDAPVRGRDRSEDTERAPRSQVHAVEDTDEPTEKPRSTGAGWKAFSEKRSTRSEFVKNYLLPTEASLIKILDAEPFSVYSEHWIDELPGKKSFICLGDDCPLCAIGDKPRVYSLFNILDLADPVNPEVRPWKVSQTVTGDLHRYAQDPKTSPLNREDLYFSVFKSGGGSQGPMRTNLNPVKARDLEEDWGTEPLTEQEISGLPLYTEDDVLVFSSRKTLQEIADSLD